VGFVQARSSFVCDHCREFIWLDTCQVAAAAGRGGATAAASELLGRKVAV
jgi:hypothetical protein